MEDIVKIKNILEENGYTPLSDISCSMDFNIRKGVNSCNPIIEILTSDLDHIKVLLEDSGYRIMIRRKSNSISQLLLKR